MSKDVVFNKPGEETLNPKMEVTSDGKVQFFINGILVFAIGHRGHLVRQYCPALRKLGIRLSRDGFIATFAEVCQGDVWDDRQ